MSKRTVTMKSLIDENAILNECHMSQKRRMS